MHTYIHICIYIYIYILIYLFIYLFIHTTKVLYRAGGLEQRPQGRRYISLLRFSLLRLLDSNFPGNSLWAWESKYEKTIHRFDISRDFRRESADVRP